MYFSGSRVPSLRCSVMKPKVKPCRPSALRPTRIGVHSTRASTLSGLARSDAVAASRPRCSVPGGPRRDHTGPNIAVIAVTASVRTAAVAKPQSASNKSWAAAAGVACAAAGAPSSPPSPSAARARPPYLWSFVSPRQVMLPQPPSIAKRLAVSADLPPGRSRRRAQAPVEPAPGPGGATAVVHSRARWPALDRDADAAEAALLAGCARHPTRPTRPWSARPRRGSAVADASSAPTRTRATCSRTPTSPPSRRCPASRASRRLSDLAHLSW